MGIQVKKLAYYLLTNSNFRADDEIDEITVDKRKSLVKIKGENKEYSATFDEMERPLMVKRPLRDKLPVILFDDEEETEVEDNDSSASDEKSEDTDKDSK